MVVRVDQELLDRVDRLISGGSVGSRSKAIRVGLGQLIEGGQRAELGRRIVDGYVRFSPADDPDGWAEAAARAMIEAEPW
ncbi:MAG TPA: ribbon-helix-helix domain-containing protein [Actinomycetota bacterium]|nr:ribbon-helix-helix domain-containing protein [Actinomycetota bacterium]